MKGVRGEEVKKKWMKDVLFISAAEIMQNLKCAGDLIEEKV